MKIIDFILSFFSKREDPVEFTSFNLVAGWSIWDGDFLETVRFPQLPEISDKSLSPSESNVCRKIAPP